MLKIRLARTGRANNPFMRVIVTESTNKPRTHKAVEILGTLDIKKGAYQIDETRIKYWLGVGAQASETIQNMLIDRGIVKGSKVVTQSKMVKKAGKKS